MTTHRPLQIGIGGPVGSGKTALIESLCKRLRDQYNLAVVTNDIYTQEDAQFLTQRAALDERRILGVETGGCPHTAIREDASMNLNAVAELEYRFPDLDVIFHRKRRGQSQRHLQPGAGGPHHLCDRCGGRRQDPPQGRTGDYAQRSSGHQQGRFSALCGGGPGGYGKRRKIDAQRTPRLYLQI